MNHERSLKVWSVSDAIFGQETEKMRKGKVGNGNLVLMFFVVSFQNFITQTNLDTIMVSLKMMGHFCFY